MRTNRFGLHSLVALSLAVAVTWALPAQAENDLVEFSKGALIIPEQATFQKGDGALAAYGLVWRILQSNQPGGYNADHPVTIYWVINGTKGSPNRCSPSNLQRPPTTNKKTPAWDDAKWNDGCDLKIVNTADQPVVPVDYTKAWPTSGLYASAAIPNWDTTGGSALPGYSNTTLTKAKGFNTVQYMGGPFVIDAPDAKNVINFLRDSGTSADIKKFTQTTGCNTTSTPKLGSCFFVQMHQATAGFSAYVGRRINKVPPKLALLDSGSGVSTGILNEYLKSAGLDFDGSAGCPAGTTSGCSLNGGKPGLIYDQFHAIKDLISTSANPYGLLNAKGTDGKLIYTVFWTPHWDLDIPTYSKSKWSDSKTTYTDYVSNGDGAANPGVNALNNIAKFLDNKGTGLMAECASIETYEGSLHYKNIGSKKHPNYAWATNVDQYDPATKFLYTADLYTNGVGGGNSTSDQWVGRNCTDPDYKDGQCVVYPNSGDPFSQMGDFSFTAKDGAVNSYHQGTGSDRRAGVRRLAYSWDDYTSSDSGKEGDSATQDGWDFFSVSQKDNDPKKATIVYLGGHTYEKSIPGTRIVLNTLLNLGSNPIGSERALSQPVAYVDPNGSDSAGTSQLVFASTFEAVSGYGSDSAVSTYSQAAGSRWVFPLIPGHLRAHSLTGTNALAAGESDLDEASLWDADSLLPQPGNRNLFTYFGGKVGTVTGASHEVLQTGWKPEKVDGNQLASGSCVDVMSYGKYSVPDVDADGKPIRTDKFGMVPGADGICDLQQALQSVAVDPGDDFGVSTKTANIAALAGHLTSDQQLLQRVRGYCFATTGKEDGSGTPVLNPEDSDCNNDESDNRAHLGGLVHSSPAVVPPSPKITDAPSGKSRPTMVYAAGLDGQLHAFYVSGGSGYEGPADLVTPPNPNATAAFSHDYATDFKNGNLPPAGTELWSFLPASQLPYLAGNSAQVDSSPVVADVFADFDQSGIRTWRTILVASIGSSGRELFAIDITNPLKPTLLWDIAGSLRSDPSVVFSPIALANDTTGGTGYAFKFNEATATFQLPSASDPGAIPAGLYDYSDLGGARGISIGQLRNGLAPVFAIFVASNSSTAYTAPAKGIEVFAIDVATGQKVWQWEQPYTETLRSSDNTVPPPVTITRNSDGANRAYVADMEGRLWELDAPTGMNLNVFTGTGCSTSAPCKFAAFDSKSTVANPQPLTTNVSFAKIPQDVADTSLFGSYGGANVALIGTAGADWVPDTVAGKLHVLMLDSQYRVPFATGGKSMGVTLTQTAALAKALDTGVLQEPATMPAFAAGDHLYGTLTVAGQTVFVPVAHGAVNDYLSLSGKLTGKTYGIDLGTATSAATMFAIPGMTYANFGGVAVVHDPTGGGHDSVISLEVSKIGLKKDPGTAGHATPDPSLATQGPLWRLKAWVTHFLSN